MSMHDDRALSVMRNQAWERAKGEMRSMYHTFYNNYDSFKKLEDEVENFIKEVEDNGLQE